MNTTAFPAHVPGYGPIVPFTAGEGARVAKVMPTLRAAIEASGLKDGGTVSFHHHLRNGDQVINMVLDQIASMGISDITVAASSLFAVHAPLVEHIRQGVIGGIHAASMRLT